MARKRDRSPEELARREKIRELLQLANVGSRVPRGLFLWRISGERILPCGDIAVILPRGQLRQLPLVAIVVVVIEPVIDVAPGVIKRFPESHLVGQFVLHMAVEALLRRVVPAFPRRDMLCLRPRSLTSFMKTALRL